MKLSPGEKLILAMLADIHKHLGVEGEIDADFVLEAIHGDTWGLEWRYGSLFSDEEPTKETVKETGEILTMWRVIENGLEALSPEDRQAVEEKIGAYGIKFEGFDGNNDSHYGVMKFMVEKLGRFDERADGPFNSHSSVSLPRYRQMLERYNQIAPAARYKLDKAQLLEILGG